MSVESDVTSVPITLPADLHMGGVEALRQTLVEQVKADAPLVIDGAAVDRVSTAGIQLLVAFFRDRGSAQKPTSWTQISDALRDAIQWLGLAEHLALSTHQQTQQS